MVLPLNIQINMVIFSFLAGIIIGFIFDIYRLIRGFNSSKIILIIQDILFWLLTTMIIFVFLLVFNYGFLNIYVYLLITFGLTFYLALFSKRIFKIENIIVRNSYEGFRIFGKNIRYLFKNIFIK